MILRVERATLRQRIDPKGRRGGVGWRGGVGRCRRIGRCGDYLGSSNVPQLAAAAIAWQQIDRVPDTILTAIETHTIVWIGLEIEIVIGVAMPLLAVAAVAWPYIGLL